MSARSALRLRSWLGIVAGTALLLTVVWVPAAVAGPAATWYAAPTASGLGDCSSVSNPCTLGAAIAHANADTTTADTVMLAGGTYNFDFTVEAIDTSMNLTAEPSTTPVLKALSTNNGVLGVVKDGVSLNVTGLTLEDGQVGAGSTSATGSISLSGVTVSGNSLGGVVTQGGSISLSDGSTVTGNSGWGLAGGAMSVSDSTISNNSIAGVAQGNGAVTISKSTITGNTSGGFLDMGTGTVTVTDSAITGNSGGIGGEGPVSITDSTISDNTNGGILAGAGSSTVTGSQVDDNSGGGIALEEASGSAAMSLTVANTSIDNNGGPGILSVASTAPVSVSVSDSTTVNSNAGAGIEALSESGSATVTVADASVSSNGDRGILGGSVTVSNSDVSKNNGDGIDAVGSGASIAVSGSTTVTGNAGGGLLSTGPVSVSDSAVTGNTGGGAGIFGDSVTLSNATVSDNSADGIISVAQTGTAPVAVTGSTISGNGGASSAISAMGDVTLSSSTVSDNAGGAIESGSTNGPTSVAVTGSTISGNGGTLAAIYALGAVTLSSSAVSDNAGGAIESGSTNGTGPVTVTDSTISGNGGSSVATVIAAGPITMSNATVSNNTAGGIAAGGGTISGSTIADNAGSGILALARVTLGGDIIAGNGTASGTDCAAKSNVADAGGNVDSDGSCGLSSANGSISGSSTITASLSPLAANGGPAKTMALKPGSPALGLVSSSVQVDGSAVCSGTDERGVPRPSNDCDAGAWQFGKASTPTITNLPANPTYGEFFEATVSTTGDGVKSVTSSTLSVCSVDATDPLKVSFVGVGTCTLTAHVADGLEYVGADGTGQSLTVGQGVASAPTITNLPSSPTEGQSFLATVSTTGDGTKSVTSSTPKVCEVSQADPLQVTFVGVGTCTLTAHVGDGTDTTGADGSPQQTTVGQTRIGPPISPPAPAPVVSVSSSEPTSVAGDAVTFTATVTPAPDCGSVSWLVDNAAPPTGTQASGSGATYTLGPIADLTVGLHTITAVYSGCPDASGSSGTLHQTVTATPPASNVLNPTIVAHVSSSAPKNGAGWYRHPVAVWFTCTAGSAPLTAPCPSAVILRHDGKNQEVSRTISDADGGSATATIRGINIDRTAPGLQVTGVVNDRLYHRPPRLHCDATDALSGVASCAISRTHSMRNGVRHVRWTAVATDNAGNQTTQHGRYSVESRH